jgi:uncharacterized protein (DUF58 family)
MIPPEFLKKIRHIEIRAFRLVEDLLAGQYHSVFKGRGMDFDEVREYQHDDDVRHIDWNVTAKTGVVHIKKYIEEREMTVMLLVDASGSGTFGSVNQSKRELAAEIAAVLALSAIRNNDKVGLLLFTDRTEKLVRPGKGRSHVMRLISEILSHQPASRGTDLSAALNHISHALPRRSTIFVLSDFMDADFSRALKVTGRKHDVIAVPVSDASERELPDVGWIVFEDAETGEILEIDTGDARARQSFRDRAESQAGSLQQTLRRSGVDSIEVQTDQPYLKALIKFFETRFHRLHP